MEKKVSKRDISRGNEINNDVIEEYKILQKLLVYQVIGIATYTKSIIDRDEIINDEVIRFIEKSMTEFREYKDINTIITMLKTSQKLKVLIRSMTLKGIYPNECTYNLPYNKEEMITDSIRITFNSKGNEKKEVLVERNRVIEKLGELCDISKLAREMGIRNYRVERFYFILLKTLTNQKLDEDELIKLIEREEKNIVQVKNLLEDRLSNGKIS